MRVVWRKEGSNRPESSSPARAGRNSRGGGPVRIAGARELQFADEGEPRPIPRVEARLDGLFRAPDVGA